MSNSLNLVPVSQLLDGGEEAGGRRIGDDATLLCDAHCYLPEGELEEGWSPLIREAFSHFARSLPSRRLGDVYGSVGCGPGIDSLLARIAFGCGRFLVTDVHRSVPLICAANLVANTDLTWSSVKPLVGNLCEPLASCGETVDILFENLPNMPIDPSIDIDSGDRRASFVDSASVASVPEEFRTALLSLHYRFLQQARPVVVEGGLVICCIGLRVELELVKDLFDSLDYEVLGVFGGLVLQLAADELLPHYSTIEDRSGRDFLLFPFEQSMALIEEERFATSFDGVRGILQRLDKASMTARSAAKLFRMEETHPGILDRQRVGHMGLVLCASPKP